jgi:hypothetical protein
MSKVFKVFTLLSFIFYFNYSVSFEIEQSGDIIQLSKTNKDDNVLTLKATLVVPCHFHDKKCKPQIEIKAWMERKDKLETFLLIDEIYDTNAQMSFPLLHPYMIQVSTSEPTIMYPMSLNQVVDVSCNEKELVQRRAADNEETSQNEGAEKKIAFHLFCPTFLIETFYSPAGEDANGEDLLNAVRVEGDDAIKRDLNSNNGVADGRKSLNSNDLLLYFHDLKSTSKVPSENSANFLQQKKLGEDVNENFLQSKSISMPHHFKEKFNHNVFEQRKPQNVINPNEYHEIGSANPIADDFQQNGFKFGVSPKQTGWKSVDFNSPTKPDRFPTQAHYYLQNYQHRLVPTHLFLSPSRHQNRFYINHIANGEKVDEGEVIENAIPMPGVINNHNSMDNKFMEAKKFQNDDGEIFVEVNPQKIKHFDDARVTFDGNRRQHDDKQLPYRVYQTNENSELGKKISRKL